MKQIINNEHDTLFIGGILISIILIFGVILALLYYINDYFNSQNPKNIGCAEFSRDCSCTQLKQWWDAENLANSEKTLAVEVQKGCIIQ